MYKYSRDVALKESRRIGLRDDRFQGERSPYIVS